MDVKRFLKKLAIPVFIVVSVLGLAKYCSSKIDVARAEKKERDQKLENGTCEFDKADLDKLLIKNTAISFNPITNLHILKTHFPESTRKAQLDKDTMLMATKIDNNDFKFHLSGNNIAVTYIQLDLSSIFKLQINGKKEFSCTYELDDFEEEFPKSYNCRENILVTNRREDYITRINNTNEYSQLKFMLLYFNYHEQLHLVEFYHQNINLQYQQE